MMALAEFQAVLSPDVLVGLADDNNDGIPDAEVLDAAARAAIAHVRERVAGVLHLGDDALPELLADIALTLAIERLHERRREVLPGPWSERAARARVLLDEVASGQRVLTNAPRRRAAVQHTRSPFDRPLAPRQRGY